MNNSNQDQAWDDFQRSLHEDSSEYRSAATDAISQILDEAFRRGYSRGFTAGIEAENRAANPKPNAKPIQPDPPGMEFKTSWK